MILYAFIISLVINAVLFIYAYLRQTDKLTDFSYSFSFIAVSLAAFSHGSKGACQSLVLASVIIWALRLGTFLVWRIRKTGRDKRFDDRRENFVKFGSFWLAQAVSVAVILLPVIAIFKSRAAPINSWMITGLALWLFGLIIESVADLQKSRFNANTANKGRWIDEGLWHYSRHPNYLGEIIVWFGVYIAAFTYISTVYKLLGIVSPIYIALLLRFVSGAPILEKAAQQKWGSDRGYREYVIKTGLILPKFISR